MTTCVVHLCNFHGQYYPGNTITGKVICSFNRPINIRGVKVTLHGIEHTEWQEKVTVDSRDKSSNMPNFRLVRYTGNNNVLEIVTTLTGDGNYPAGRYEYPFSFALPKNIPGTFQGVKGWIKYKIKGKTIIPFGIDYQDVKEIRVVSPVNLNETPGVQLAPVTFTAEKTLRWLFKSCGVISMKMYSDKNAFVQGERANVRLELMNMSTENVTKVEAKMLLITESHVTHPSKETKRDQEVLAIASDTGVGAHGERTYQFDMVIPESLVLTNFGICRLFRQSAKIEIVAHLGAFYSNLELSADIYLGTTLNTDPQLLQPVPQRCEYSSGMDQSPSAPREQPPPYSPFPQYAQTQTSLYPVIQPTAPIDEMPYKQPPKLSDAEEKLDDDFVLI